MPSEETTERLRKYLRDLISQTKEEKLKWIKRAPTAFYADFATPPGRVHIQRLPAPTILVPIAGRQEERRKIASHILQIADSSTRSLVMQMKSGQDGDMETAVLLNDLFDTIQNIFARKAVDFFGRLLGDPGA